MNTGPIHYWAMNNNSVFVVEKDSFVIEADAEEGIEYKWWTIAEDILKEDPLKKYWYLI